MKLYDSYGNLVDTKRLVLMDDELINKICDFVRDAAGDEELEMDIKDKFNIVEFYQAKTFQKDEFSEEKTYICGVDFQINPVDGKVCNVSYFSTDLEKFREDNNGIEIPAKNFLCQSVVNDENFKEIGKIMDAVKKDFHFEEKDVYAFNKNMYLIQYKTAKTDNSDMYRIFKDFKASKMIDSYGCRYKDNLLYFQINGKQDCAEIYNGMICYAGYVFKAAESFLIAYKRGLEYNEMRYGTDKKFMDFIMRNTNKELPTKEKFEEEEYEQAN